MANNRSLDLTIISAKDLNKINLVGKMSVYAVVYIDGAANQNPKQKTPIDKEGDTNPTWNHPMKFTIDESAALHNRLTLVVKLKTEGMFGDKDLGEVNVPVKELLEGDSTGGKPLQFVTYQVRKPSGKPKGELNFSYKFGEKSVEEPLYPAVEYGSSPLFPPLYAAPPISAASECYPPPATASGDSYPPLVTAAGGNSYPPPAVTGEGDSCSPSGGANYPPPAGYPPAPPQAYGGYPSHPAYAYPPVQQPQQKNNSLLDWELGY